MFHHSQPQSQGPPLPPPWYSEWDQRENRYVFINPQTGQRTFDHPHPTYQQQGNYGGGYPQQGGYGGAGYNQQQAYGQQQPGYQQAGYVQHPPPQQAGNHKAMEYGAIGAVAGMAAGGLAMYEGQKIHRDWEEDKERLEGHGRERFEGREEYGERRGEGERWAERREEEREEEREERRDYEEERFEDRMEEREERRDERVEDAYEERREERFDDY